MLTNNEIQNLKRKLHQLRQESLKIESSTEQDENIREASGELSMADNHPADMGTALFDREKDRALHEHAESGTEKIENALSAIEAGKYGKCEVCEKDIPYERLLIIPYTTLCIEHAEAVEQSIKNDVTLNEIENPFESTINPKAIDYENSFEEVAEFGTSDSPSDFIDPAHPSYVDDNQESPPIDQAIEKLTNDDN